MNPLTTIFDLIQEFRTTNGATTRTTTRTTKQFLGVCLFAGLSFCTLAVEAKKIPHLQTTNGTTQLIVNDAPFLILGGELGNSSAASLDYLQPHWSTFKTMHLNTLLAPVYWDLIEPEQGKFDFSLVDGLLKQARREDMKLVLLWFGSWKNSMSSYVPRWVKRDSQRFPRAVSHTGEPQEILTPFSDNNLAADRAAYSALLRHLKKTDGKHHTVIMVQVENEIGMLPSARDHHPAATAAFQQAVPHALIDYLQQHREQLTPHVRKAWESQGFKTRGNWSEVFGERLATEEMFIAWYFARYANDISAAGKAIYPLPTFINAALNRAGALPGEYPSGGPLPHIIDIWKAAAPDIDFMSPDFYNPDFKHWNDLYARPDNPLFIPEIRFDASVGAKAFYALGHYKALGFSPFSIESTSQPNEEPLAKSYEVLAQILPLVSQHQAQNSIDGVLLDKNSGEQQLVMGDYIFTVKHDYTLGWSPAAKNDVWPEVGALILQTGTDEFLVAGTGVVVTFSVNKNAEKRAGIEAIYEGKFIKGQWQAGRNLNGDQSHQGRHLRIPAGDYGIQKLTLYQY